MVVPVHTQGLAVWRIGGVHARILAVSGGHHHQPVHVLEAPAVFDELDRQPVQQFRMRGWVAYSTEVTGRADDAGPEMMLPQTIDQHASRQWIVLACQPTRQGGTSSGRFPLWYGKNLWRRFIEKMGKARLKLLERFAPVAACQHVRRGVFQAHIGYGHRLRQRPRPRYRQS